MEEWWKSSKRSRELSYVNENEKIYNNHGKNYFEGFALKERKEELEEEYLGLLFEKYINVFVELEPNPEIKCFKNDILFNKYLDRKEEQREKLSISEKECAEMKKYLNNSEISHYTLQKNIVEYLKSKQKNIPYFRVISRTDNKVREAFPFASTTFSELYQGEINESTDSGALREYKKYEDSCLKREIEKDTPVFVIDWEMNQESENSRIAKDIKYIPSFSFKEYKDKAKEVYDLTVKAFENGDEETFPKMSDKKCFHVRPKAANANDTFEFSNGNQITKRTFWANKDTVDSLLDLYLNKLKNNL